MLDLYLAGWTRGRLNGGINYSKRILLALAGRQALEASWPSHRNYTSWQKRFNKLRAELGMQEETLQARVREGHLPSFRAYVRWSIYERDRAVREEGARNESTLATYMQHYNDDINYFKPQPYLCTGPLSKGMELIIMQLRDVFFLSML